jgi:hypothetical protein
MASANTIGGALSVAQLGLSGVAAVALPAAAAITAVAIAWNKFITETNKKGAEDVKNAWTDLFETQISKGASATEILDEYRKAQARVQDQLEMSPDRRAGEKGLYLDDLAKLFIKDKDQLMADQEGLNNALARTTETYQGYLDVVRYGQVDVKLMTEEQWNAVNGITAFEEAVTSAADESASSFQEMVDAASKTKGELSGLLTEYQNISTEMDNWVANTASGVVNMLGTKLPEASQAYKDALGEVDAVMGTDYVAQYELKEAVKGLVDQYARTNDLDAFRSGLQAIKDDGLANMQTQLDEVTTKAQELYDKLMQIPSDIKIAIQFDVEELPSWIMQGINKGEGTISTEDLKWKEEALGGSVYPGLPYLVGERGMEMFVPQTAGKIVPANQVGTRSVVFETGSIQVTAPNKNTDIPFLVDTLIDEIQRRIL